MINDYYNMTNKDDFYLHAVLHCFFFVREVLVKTSHLPSLPFTHPPSPLPLTLRLEHALPCSSLLAGVLLGESLIILSKPTVQPIKNWICFLSINKVENRIAS